MALHDTGGTWSDAVYPVATANAGCSVTSSGTDPPTKSPSKAPTNAPTDVSTAIIAWICTLVPFESSQL